MPSPLFALQVEAETKKVLCLTSPAIPTIFSDPFPENYQYTVLESLPVKSVVARIKAADADIGSNAEMNYRIMDGDGPGMFNITTDEDTQEGVIILQKVQLVQQTHLSQHKTCLCQW